MPRLPTHRRVINCEASAHIVTAREGRGRAGVAPRELAVMGYFVRRWETLGRTERIVALSIGSRMSLRTPPSTTECAGGHHQLHRVGDCLRIHGA